MYEYANTEFLTQFIPRYKNRQAPSILIQFLLLARYKCEMWSETKLYSLLWLDNGGGVLQAHILTLNKRYLQRWILKERAGFWRRKGNGTPNWKYLLEVGAWRELKGSNAEATSEKLEAKTSPTSSYYAKKEVEILEPHLHSLYF